MANQSIRGGQKNEGWSRQISNNRKWYLIGAGVILLMVIGGLFWSIKNFNSEPANSKSTTTPTQNLKGTVAGTNSGNFLGEKGNSVESQGGRVLIDETKVNDGNLHAFNYFSPELEKTIYFFVIKASDGTYRVAANACEVCFGSQKGFSQVGNQIRCDNCRVTYLKDQIALQKGGCNPRPIDANAQVESGQVMIQVEDIEATADLF